MAGSIVLEACDRGGTGEGNVLLADLRYGVGACPRFGGRIAWSYPVRFDRVLDRAATTAKSVDVGATLAGYNDSIRIDARVELMEKEGVTP